jgi:hypothetical protein
LHSITDMPVFSRNAFTCSLDISMVLKNTS